MKQSSFILGMVVSVKVKLFFEMIPCNLNMIFSQWKLWNELNKYCPISHSQYIHINCKCIHSVLGEGNLTRPTWSIKAVKMTCVIIGLSSLVKSPHIQNYLKGESDKKGILHL